VAGIVNEDIDLFKLCSGFPQDARAIQCVGEVGGEVVCAAALA
jgi:hypothetical protein